MSYKRPEIGVCTQGGFAVIYAVRARGVLNAPCLTATGIEHLVPRSQGTLGQSEFVVEYVDEQVVDRHGLLHEGLDSALHARIHRRRILAVDLVRPGESIVLGDIDELDCVKRTRLVYGVGASGLIAAE